MRAIGVTEYGGPDVLRVLDLRAEPLGPGQVRVRVTAAAVNPTDTGIRAGLRSTTGHPADGADVPGMDVAGVVTEIGDGVRDDLTPGTRVMGIVVPSGAHGGYREDLVLPERSATRVPAGASDVEAATLPMNGLTARQALDLMELGPGQVLAVTGAAGAFGGYVIQLAKAHGLTVVADASPSDEALVRDLGADVVVQRGDDVAERIREQYPDGVDGLADGALLDAAALPAVRDGGVVTTVRGYAGDGQRGLRVRPVIVRKYAEDLERLDGLRELVEQGAVTLRVADTYPADRAAEAHHRLEAGGTRGRLVLRFE
ncbi:NADP-dependent oxidoreductase [Cryptosporangium phraense]|uniref:NADP-dependent oxidoreductase n=1 Tax=Cryptosporangium phraense TaxID=2593070 RepID=A0A545APB7_9ACTN|nr:NADP-dependent oxidoreductase [Cryptosporangium phraense]TQS42585.1 NADP-dependent oxidoreductase [Cryptosporangium phraense]